MSASGGVGARRGAGGGAAGGGVPPEADEGGAAYPFPMSLFPTRTASALLVIDMQEDVVAQAVDTAGVTARIACLVERARGLGVPVVWVQHSDEELRENSSGWELVAGLDPVEGEPRIAKHYGDSFEATDLEEVLDRRGVGRLVVTGAQTDACVRSTLHGAFTRGYDVTLVGDSHTTEDLREYGAPAPEGIIAHTNLYWSFQDAPGREAAVVPAAEVTF